VDAEQEDLAIDVRGAVKTYGAVRALDGLDLSVTTGEVHGFLGPNGAGKSTTLRALLGLHRTDAGTLRLLGKDPWRDATTVHRQLAYVPGDVSLWPNLTGGEVIDLLIRMRGEDPARTRRDELMERFELDPTKKGRAYSKGNRQKVALVAALAGEVPLLLLDEPTSGLDPLMERVFAEEVRAWARDGRTVLLSSHILSEVEALCERVTIIKAGRAVETGSLADLRHLRRTRVRAELASRVGPEVFTGVAGLHDVSVEEQVLTCTADAEAIEPLLQRLTGVGVGALTCTPPSLEELFLDVYRGDGPRSALPAGNRA
jgi:ABC-2 type transport system ATP-binding protein